MGSWRRSTLFCLVLLFAGFLFLALRAAHPNRFSLWDFGDAQTLMAATVFRDEGFLSTHFLWVPQPSSPIGKYLDDPQVRHHAHGSAGDAHFSGLGPKRIYTHWPSWYSIPYGLLAKLGIYGKTAFQLWASLLSIVSLAFLFLFLRKIASEWASCLAVLVYFFSPGFLGYADSLATMPYDDFFRFGFLWLWARELELAPRNIPRGPGLFFLGSLLTTLDSLFFLPVAAFLSEKLITKKIDWNRMSSLFFFGIAAVAVQWAQNVAYLGWREAWLDWKGYFLGYSDTTLGVRLDAALMLFQRTFNLILPVGALLLVAVWFLRQRTSRQGEWLITLALAGMAFAVMVPGKSTAEYQSRQLMPLVLLAYGVLFDAIRGRLAKARLEREASLPAFLAVAIVGVLNFYALQPSSLREALDYPSAPHVRVQQSELLKKLEREIPGEKVIFQFGGAFKTNQHYARPGYGQVDPVEEYFAGHPVLTVPGFESLSEDLGYFWSKAQGSFQPVLVLRLDGVTDTGQLAEKLESIRYPWKLTTVFQEGDLAVLRLDPLPEGRSEG